MADLISSACVLLTHILGKACEEVKLCSFLNVFEKGVHLMEGLGEVHPVSPMSQRDCLSLSHDPLGTAVPCSKVQTSELILLVRRSISHEAALGFRQLLDELTRSEGGKAVFELTEARWAGAKAGWVLGVRY